MTDTAQNPSLKLTRNIALTGMMGAGKSAIGRRLAETLEAEFKDADAEIEAAAGMSIGEIFAQHGEAHFRDGERRVITRLLQEKPARPLVLALGGGAFINEATRQIIQQSAFCIWLDVALPELVKRVQKRPEKRPLLDGAAGGDIEDILAKLLAARAPIYAQADLTIQSTTQTLSATLRAIIAQLRKHAIVAETGVAQ